MRLECTYTIISTLNCSSLHFIPEHHYLYSKLLKPTLHFSTLNCSRLHFIPEHHYLYSKLLKPTLHPFLYVLHFIDWSAHTSLSLLHYLCSKLLKPVLLQSVQISICASSVGVWHVGTLLHVSNMYLTHALFKKHVKQVSNLKRNPDLKDVKAW